VRQEEYFADSNLPVSHEMRKYLKPVLDADARRGDSGARHSPPAANLSKQTVIRYDRRFPRCEATLWCSFDLTELATPQAARS
jgi:hypothetical protein